MQTYLSDCYKGPITHNRGWWPRAEEMEDFASLATEPVPSLDDPEIRTDLVLRIRQEIADGDYDTPERMELALDRLLARLEQ